MDSLIQQSDSLASRIQGLFADAIRTLAAIIVIITFIQQIEPSFDMAFIEFEDTLLNLIDSSYGLYIRVDYHEILRETMAELHALSSARDFSNLYDVLSNSHVYD